MFTLFPSCHIFCLPARFSDISNLFSGCKVSRFRDFIVDFYSRSTEGQNVDEAFCAFVWSAVVQQPTIRIGIVPPGLTSTVYIAPQRATQRKNKDGNQEEAPPITLQVIPDAALHPLETLVQQYGDNLRIAVDPDTVFVAITGSHTRVCFSSYAIVCLSPELSFSSSRPNSRQWYTLLYN